MRSKLFIRSLILILLLTGCHRQRASFILTGNIATLGNDTVLIYGNNEYFDHIEAVSTRHGQFKFKFYPDTITPLWIAFPNGHREFLFAEKNTETSITGDAASAGHLTISGGAQNTLLAEFDAIIRDTILSLSSIQVLADSFISAHPFDDASVWLLQKYFVDVQHPDLTLIRSGYSKMSGNLQDNSYVNELKNRLANHKNRDVTIIVGNYNVEDTLGRHITSVEYGDSCVLLTLWASWDEESRQRQREYRALLDTFAGRPFTILSVSLDVDREAWLKAIREDSMTWHHGNSFQSWDLELEHTLDFSNIPSNALLSPQRRVRAHDIYGNELKEKIATILADEEQKKAEREQAEKEAKKNKNKKSKK